MQPEWTNRIGWSNLPSLVQANVERVLGSPVVSAITQRGGFSPGTADRVVTAAGTHAFIKAVHPSLNEATPRIHRKEAAITAAMESDFPIATLIASFDDDEWVTLVFSDIDGRTPEVPWVHAEITVVLDALLSLAATPVPQALAHLPRLGEELSVDFAGWSRVRNQRPEYLDRWTAENLDRLEDMASHSTSALAGESLVHSDIRADNILLTNDGAAVIVDWPWACIGSPWFDALTLLMNVRTFDAAFDVDSLIDSHAIFSTASSDDIDAVLAGLGAYFIDVARRPAPDGLPTVRAFQQQQGDAVITWLRQRIEAQTQQQ